MGRRRRRRGGGRRGGGGGGVGKADGHILLSVPGLCDAPPLIPRTEWGREGEEEKVGGRRGERGERGGRNEQQKQMCRRIRKRRKREEVGTGKG